MAFNDGAFGTKELTEAVNVIPNMYGRVGELGVFSGRGVRVPKISIEHKDGKLGMVAFSERYSPPEFRTPGKRKLRDFTVPHIARRLRVGGEAVEGLRAFGDENALESVAQAVRDAQEDLRSDIDITVEHLRVKALQGLLVDADGSTDTDFFSEFGISKKTIDFVLDNAATEIIEKANEVTRHISKNLKGDTMTGVHALCSPGFFDAMLTHDHVKETYLNQQDARDLRNNGRNSFRFGNITFEEYHGEATGSDGANKLFIPEDEAIAFPLGTRNTFIERYAPADWKETVNTIGVPFYSKMYPEDTREAADIVEVQANPIPVCVRPEVLVELTLT